MPRRVTRKPRQSHPSSRSTPQSEAPRETAPPKRSVLIAGGAGALALALAVYLLRLDPVLGQYQDDAWYTVLAKALATGQGYTLISAPVEGIGAWVYPPVYPGLLSLAWRLWPEFPQNVWLLKSISVAAMFGVGVACFYYFRDVRGTSLGVAAGIALATTLSPALVFLATSTMMSEGVFTLVQLLTILTIERAQRAESTRPAWVLLILGGLLASLTLLTRALGLSLSIGIGLYLLKQRQIRSAIVTGAVVASVVLPWVVFAQLRSPTEEQRAQQASYIVGRMSEIFWQRQAGNADSGRITVRELPDRVRDNALSVLTHDLGVMVLAPLPYWEKGGEMTAEGVRSSPTSQVLSLLVSALAIVGFLTAARTRVTLSEIVVVVTIAIILIFPWTPFRYLLPLLPFFVFYVLLGARSCYGWVRRHAPSGRQTVWAVPSIIAACFVALNVYSNTAYILKKHSEVPAERPEWIRAFVEHQALFKWIRDNIPGDQTLISANPPQLYLYTGLKTMPAGNAALRPDILKQNHVRYLVQMGVPRPPDVNAAEEKFDAPYRSHTAMNLRVVDLGDRFSR
jgi:hypothetical protein